MMNDKIIKEKKQDVIKPQKAIQNIPSAKGSVKSSDYYMQPSEIKNSGVMIWPPNPAHSNPIIKIYHNT